MTKVAYDNSTLHDFKVCMRMGYFKHVRKWTPAGKSPALIFGSAWHSAMDAVWAGLTAGAGGSYHQEDIENAGQEAFRETWEKEGGPVHIPVTHMKMWQPRLPQVAFQMIESYVAKRASSLKHLTIVESEVPFAVPILPGVWYTGKRDKLVRDRTGKHTVVDHKTTTWGSKSGFRDVWKNTWSPKSQIDGYLFSAGLAYPKLNVSAWIDGALVSMNDRLFEFIAVARSADNLDAWLWETRYWIGTIEQHKAALPQRGDFMAAFPKNDASCVQYNRVCPFLDICKGCANPEKLVNPPAGMVESTWSPMTPQELEELTK